MSQNKVKLESCRLTFSIAYFSGPTFKLPPLRLLRTKFSIKNKTKNKLSLKPSIHFSLSDQKLLSNMSGSLRIINNYPSLVRKRQEITNENQMAKK